MSKTAEIYISFNICLQTILADSVFQNMKISSVYLTIVCANVAGSRQRSIKNGDQLKLYAFNQKIKEYCQHNVFDAKTMHFQHNIVN